MGNNTQDRYHAVTKYYIIPTTWYSCFITSLDQLSVSGNVGSYNVGLLEYQLRMYIHKSLISLLRQFKELAIIM